MRTKFDAGSDATEEGHAAGVGEARAQRVNPCGDAITGEDLEHVRFHKIKINSISAFLVR